MYKQRRRPVAPLFTETPRLPTGRYEQCPICGEWATKYPEHIFKLYEFGLAMRSGGGNNEKRYVWYGYRCANSHRWESTKKPKPMLDT